MACGLVGGLIALVFPPAGAIIFILGALGSFKVAFDKAREKLGKVNEKKYLKKLRKQFNTLELDEFDRAAKQFSRQMY